MGLLDAFTSKPQDEQREAMLGMASILSGMSHRPNTGLQNMAAQGIKSIQQKRQQGAATKAKQDRVAMAVKLLAPKHPELAQYVAQGLMTVDAAIAETRKKADSKTAIGPRGQLRHIDTGEVVKGFEGSTGSYTKDQLAQVGSLRDDVRADFKEFGLVESGWNSINTFYSNPGAVSDYALAVGFAKILDPGSVAREGEVSAVANSGSLAGAVKESIINAIKGQGKLPPAVRQEIAELSHKMYTQKAQSAQSKLGQYKATAGRMGLDFADIYYGAQIALPDAIIPAVVPDSVKASGVTQDDWGKMTQQQRKQFM